MKTFDYSENKGKEVDITTLNRDVVQGVLLGLCEDGVIIIDIDTPFGAAMREIDSKEVATIEVIQRVNVIQ